MSHPYYLITAPEKKLARIAKYARKLTGSRQGDPVIAIGSLRIVLSPPAVEKMLDAAASPVDIGQAKSFTAVVEAMGAKGAVAITPERLGQLLAARAPEELGVGRVEIDDKILYVERHDWHVKASRLVEAWAMLGGAGQIDWGDVRVGQIDTGFRPIPCLGFDAGGRSDFVLTEYDRDFFPGDFILPDYLDYCLPARAEDSAQDPLLGGAFDGHGTRTGSILAGFDTSDAATRGGKLEGFFGAAPRVPYIPVRICDSVIINHVQEPLALAIEHLTRHGCGVITLSMGIALSYVTERLRQAIDQAYEQGVILVCAAGNVWDPVVAPARLRRTLAVAGSTPARMPWLGSSFGPEVDLAAPAWPIRRATVDRRGAPSYGHGDGTSFATPQVAGTAAMWLRLRGAELAAAYPRKWQRVEAFKRVVTASVQAGEGWNRNLYGAGLLDAEATLKAALPDAASLEKDAPA